MDFVVSDDGIAPSSHLNSRQCIAVDVVILDQTATFSKYVYATLMSIVNLIFPTPKTSVKCLEYLAVVDTTVSDHIKC